MIGTILRQRYKIIDKLGSGGIGETYLAEDLDLPVTPKPKCVVKRLHPMQIHPDIVRLFEREAQILYKLGQNHPQIPKLFAYFQENQEFYLIQELIEGQDLSHTIVPGKQWSETEAIELLRELLELLVYVHQQNAIHRDIKPANIMRRPDGKLVLIDFGIVKEVSTLQVNAPGVTTRTVSIGTPGYMPSEQAMGKPKLSSDIYAVGITAIFALTGIPPQQLREDNNGELIWRNGVAVRDELAEILTKMVRYDFRQRYADAAEALAAIAPTISPSQSPTTISRSQKSSPPAKPIRLLALGGVLMVTGVAIATAIAVFNTPQPSPPQVEEKQPAPRAAVFNTPQPSPPQVEEKEPTPRAAEWPQKGDEPPQNTPLKLLDNLLVSGKWKEADRQTDTLMTTGFDCQKLSQIDSLWVKYSGGRFGYSVQKRIWESSRGNKPYESFADRVGWRVNNSWLRQDNLNFTLNAPEGHLPWSGWQVSGQYREGFGSFMAKLATCNE